MPRKIMEKTSSLLNIRSKEIAKKEFAAFQ
jgi:hypothetical protein